jgi:hypothetical protein
MTDFLSKNKFLTITVRPELVEGLSFLCAAGEEERGFDKLSPNGNFCIGTL